MYCRNCNNELDEKSVFCVKCGFDPMTESKFCHNCGIETIEKQIVCIKCGVSLTNKVVNKYSKSKSNLPDEYDGFYRSSDEKFYLGVCGGLSHKFDIQLGLVRFLVFCSLFFFIGWLYFGGLFIPKLPTKNV
tara:strand:+ start:164 stop:559 length:396 start_codon:yes stop_codon:yes gene_type:complete